MNNIKLVALDMDGTFLNKKSEITEVDKNAVKMATSKGVNVVISTGRPYVGLPIDLLHSIGVEYVITANSSAIYKIPDKECIYSSCLDTKLICEVMRKLQKMDVQFDVFADGDAYSQKSFLDEFDRLSLTEQMKEYRKKTRFFAEDIVQHIEENNLVVQKITVNFYKNEDGTYSDYDKVVAELSNYPEIVYVSGGFHNLELTKAGTTKEKGLRFLVEKLGIDISETMACGDSENDLDIIKVAGIGVAMGNASEDVKQAADYITFSNDEGGVAHAIEKFIGV